MRIPARQLVESNGKQHHGGHAEEIVRFQLCIKIRCEVAGFGLVNQLDEFDQSRLTLLVGFGLWLERPLVGRWIIPEKLQFGTGLPLERRTALMLAT